MWQADHVEDVCAGVLQSQLEGIDDNSLSTVEYALSEINHTIHEFSKSYRVCKRCHDGLRLYERSFRVDDVDGEGK